VDVADNLVSSCTAEHSWAFGIAGMFCAISQSMAPFFINVTIDMHYKVGAPQVLYTCMYYLSPDAIRIRVHTEHD
jgi:hypothetical protein